MGTSPGLDIAQAREQLARIVLGWTGMGISPLEACPNDRAFVDRYKLTIDGDTYDWKKYEHMVEPFEDDHPFQVIQASAQSGKTARAIVRLLRAGVRYWGKTFGYYFPTKELPASFSTTRFRPFVTSADELGIWLGRATKKGKGLDATFIRSFGPSVFMFLTTAGRTSTESTPMKGVFFDEVRGMQARDIQKAMQRYKAQEDPLDMKVSTANFPDTDINHFFNLGDQRYFHSWCRCPEGIVLSLAYPNCIADLRKVTPEFRRKAEHAYRNHPRGYLGMTDEERAKYGDAVYLCPKCGEILPNPRDGWWEPHNPGAWVHSYQMSRLLSWNSPAGAILKEAEEAADLQEFHNSVLGLAYIDAEAQPVKLEHLLSSVNGSLSWPSLMSAAWRRKYLRNCAMGVDAMGGYNVVVVKQFAPNGKHRTVHLEIVHGDDPWKRCRALLEEYDVRICVSDAHPHWNEALRFAKSAEGRVFLATYADEAGTKGKIPMVAWKDRGKKKDQRGQETGFKFRVVLNRTNALRWSLMRWVQGGNETPDPDRLIQSLPKQKGQVILTPGLVVGQFEPTRICREVYWFHLQRVAFVRKYANDEAKRRGEFSMVAEHVGAVDPHFAHANLYADVALQRIGKPRLAETEDEET